MQDELISRRIELRYLLAQDLVGAAEKEAVAALLHDATLPPAVGDVEYQNWSRADATSAFRAARAALLHDAEAALPI